MPGLGHLDVRELVKFPVPPQEQPLFGASVDIARPYGYMAVLGDPSPEALLQSPASQ